jgi:hypothetical protein
MSAMLKMPTVVTLVSPIVGRKQRPRSSHSRSPLKTVGTPESLDLMRRIAAFWQPELNKMQRRVVNQLLGDEAVG